MGYSRQEMRVVSFATMYGSGTGRFPTCPVCRLPVVDVQEHAKDQGDPEHLALYVMGS